MTTAMQSARHQLSLFDLSECFAPSNAAEKWDTPPFIQSTNDEWNRFIAGAEALERTRIHVSLHWTAIVLERLVDFRLGHWLLWSNGTRVEYGPTPNPARDMPLRLVHKTVESVRALHRSSPLVRDLGGPGWARYRFAGPDDVVGALELPSPCVP